MLIKYQQIINQNHKKNTNYNSYEESGRICINIKK